MLFHEIYGTYYQVTASVLREAVKGTLTKQNLTELVARQAFSESVLAIPQGLQGEKWRLLRRDLTTPIRNAPSMPLTLLQKRWLKALLSDPRIRLFDPDPSGLEDVEPLFTGDMFVYFDRYSDGDDYTDPEYVKRFRTILAAIRRKQRLFVRFDTGRNAEKALTVTPCHLEYSEKDDRFRLAAVSRGRSRWFINLARLKECAVAESGGGETIPSGNTASLTFELTDFRNALERVLLHFSHLEKETERLSEQRYRVTLRYDPRDETELVIRILSFGPVIRVLEPRRFLDLVKERIDRQMTLAAFLPGNGAAAAVQSGAQTENPPLQKQNGCDRHD